MSFFSRYDKGDWNSICDVCGRKYKASLLKQRWDGLMCCPQDWEIRQPQDFVRGVPDPQLVPWVRDEPTDQFVPLHFTSWLYAASGVTSASLTFKFIPYSTSKQEIDASSINVKQIG